MVSLSAVILSECVVGLHIRSTEDIGKTQYRTFVVERITAFQDYSQLVFWPYIEHMLQDVVRVDVFWDVYR